MNERKRTDRTAIMTRIAMMTAVVAVCSQISLPMPSGVPVTLQTFAVALAGYVLGPVYGAAAIAVYVALGAAGVPVFASFKGGAAAVTGVTGGFIWGFIPMAAVTALGRRSANMLIAAVAACGGILICHAAGVLWYSVAAGTDITAAFVLVSAPYLVKDMICAAAAYAVYLPIKRHLPVDSGSNG